VDEERLKLEDDCYWLSSVLCVYFSALTLLVCKDNWPVEDLCHLFPEILCRTSLGRKIGSREEMTITLTWWLCSVDKL